MKNSTDRLTTVEFPVGLKKASRGKWRFSVEVVSCPRGCWAGTRGSARHGHLISSATAPAKQRLRAAEWGSVRHDTVEPSCRLHLP